MTDANDLSSPRSEATDSAGVAPLDAPSPNEFDSGGSADPPDQFPCGYCHRSFLRPEYRALHHGRAHPEALTAGEGEAYESAREDEADALRQFQLKAVFAIIVLYFVLLMLTALV